MLSGTRRVRKKVDPNREYVEIDPSFLLEQLPRMECRHLIPPLLLLLEGEVHYDVDEYTQVYTASAVVNVADLKCESIDLRNPYIDTRFVPADRITFRFETTCARWM